MKFKPVVSVILSKTIDVDAKDTIPVPSKDPDNYLHIDTIVRDSVMKEYIKKELNIPDWEILSIEIK